MFRDIYTEEDICKLETRVEELEDEYAKLDAYCELLMDALEDACEHMPLNEVAKLRLRHKKAMEVIA